DESYQRCSFHVPFADAIAWGAAFAFGAGLICIAPVAAPLLAAVRRLQWNRWLTVAGVGAISGMAPFLVPCLSVPSADTCNFFGWWPFPAIACLIAGMCGVAAYDSMRRLAKAT